MYSNTVVKFIKSATFVLATCKWSIAKQITKDFTICSFLIGTYYQCLSVQFHYMSVNHSFGEELSCI